MSSILRKLGFNFNRRNAVSLNEMIGGQADLSISGQSLDYLPAEALIDGATADEIEKGSIGDLPSDSNLEMYWSFDEGTGVTFTNDISVNDNRGTLNSITESSWVAGVSGSALDLDGSADYISIKNPTFIDDTAGAVSLWVRLDVNNSADVLWQVSTTTEAVNFDEFYLAYRGDTTKKLEIVLIVDGSETLHLDTTSNIITDTNWHYIVLTSDGLTIRLYVDGIEKTLIMTTGTNSGQWFASATDADICVLGATVRNSVYDLFINGKIDECRVYSTALTAKNVYALYKNPAGGQRVITANDLIDDTNLALYISFDEGLVTSAGKVYDSSPNANDLTLTGGQTNADFITGVSGTGLNFDGVNDYASKSSPSFIDNTAGAVSIWVKFDVLTTQEVLFAVSVSGVDTDALSFSFRGDDSKQINFSLQINGIVTLRMSTPNNAITDTNWHHITVTSDGSTIRIYIDAIEQTLTAVTGSNTGQWFASATLANLFSLGAVILTSTLAVLDGKLDECRVYSTALTAKQVQALYKNPAGGTKERTVADTVVAARNYDAVVATSGGDYTDIQSAIDAGKTNIFVRKGTYTLTADITLVSGLSIIGEDITDTIIDCNNYQIKILGDLAYSTGTITVTQNSKTVTGSGTTWTTNLAAGDFIITHGIVYEISSITNNTSLELVLVYEGETLSGLNYFAGTFKENLVLSRFTLTSGLVAQPMLYLRGLINSFIDNIIVGSSSTVNVDGIQLTNCFNSNFNLIKSFSNTDGINLLESDGNIFSNIFIYNNKTDGIRLTDCKFNKFNNVKSNYQDSRGIILVGGSLTCENNEFINCEFIGNTVYGIEILGGTKFINFTNCKINNNETGILLDANSNNIIISNSNILKNSQDGIKCSGGDRNIINNCQFYNNGLATNNTYSDILLTATATKNNITGNHFLADGSNKVAYNVREAAVADNYNLVHGNITEGAATADISLQGANSVEADTIAI